MEHIYLTENSAGEASDKFAAFRPMIDDGFLTLELNPKPKAQLDVYQRCLDEYKGKHNWIAFFDLDEYLVIREECAHC